MRIRTLMMLSLLILLSWGSTLWASPILGVVATSGDYTDNAYGGSRWIEMTAELNQAFGGAGNVTVLPAASGLMAYDAVWLDQRLGPILTAPEIAELSAFAASGRRMVMIGENNSWNTWNQQILGIVGGGYDGGCYWTVATTAVAHPLTAGVGTTQVACGSYAIGGLSLFTANYATLWGSDLNVLTILDSNMQEQVYRTYDNAQFFGNVAEWLAGGQVPIPEPGTMALIGFGLAMIAIVRRRR